jgi:hypothetical protein
VFESAVSIIFQNIFYLAMHQNNILLLFFKIIFNIKTLKQFENIKKIIKLKIKKFNIKLAERTKIL